MRRAGAAAERARRFEFEEAQRGRTERAIRDALRTADDATTEMRKRFQEEREDLSDQMLKQEQEFKAALAEAQYEARCASGQGGDPSQGGGDATRSRAGRRRGHLVRGVCGHCGRGGHPGRPGTAGRRRLPG